MLDAGSGLGRAAWARHAQSLIAGGEDARLHFWSRADAAADCSTTRHDKAVAALGVAADGGRLCSAGHVGAAIVWNAHKGAEILRANLKCDGAMRGVMFSADASRALSWGTQGTAWLWSTETGAVWHTLDWKPVLSRQPNQRPMAVPIAPASIRLASRMSGALPPSQNQSRSGTTVSRARNSCRGSPRCRQRLTRLRSSNSFAP